MTEEQNGVNHDGDKFEEQKIQFQDSIKTASFVSPSPPVAVVQEEEDTTEEEDGSSCCCSASSSGSAAENRAAIVAVMVKKQSDPSWSGFRYWRDKLKSPVLVVAPMVDQSELAWRVLSRKHGAQLCYTPMIHSHLFVKDRTYRKENFITCPQDRPLIAQFCANNARTLVKAAKIVAPQCDGIDLNLGCPQTIARRGFYGAFLQDHWDLIFQMVRAVHEEVCIPISCKMRIFEDVDKTIRYAQMLEKAGCQLLAVHGRTREQKGPKTGLASWDHIKAVKRSVSIPVFANGNIQVNADIQKCLDYTGADGVMVAEGNLHNPALFENKSYTTWDLGSGYLDLVDEYPCPLSCVRAHLFKIFHFSLWKFPDLRPLLGKAGSITELRRIVEMFKEKSMDDHRKYLEDPSGEDCQGLLLPHWFCQPRYKARVGNGDSAEPEMIEEQRKERRKRRHEELNLKSAETGLSKRRLRKLIRYPEKTFTDVYRVTNYQSNRTQYAKCSCGNPMGGKCPQKMCRSCCKKLSHRESRNCEAHKFWFQNIAERRRLRLEAAKEKAEL